MPSRTWPDGIPRFDRVGPINTKALKENAYALDRILARLYHLVENWKDLKI